MSAAGATRSPMRRFPREVRRGMAATHASATCVPVQLGSDAWETAIFFRLDGSESAADRRALKKARGTVPLGMETDLIEHANAAVVVLRIEVHAQADDPAVAEVLLVPGGVESHFEALSLLARQPRLAWFLGDADCFVLHAQEHPLVEVQHESFAGLLHDASAHDALVRVTGRYDAAAALGEVASHYELRSDAGAHPDSGGDPS